ncbi:hypothetical protein M9H77_07719 [Catharanthus roseus]|uniref:Uncharacterized protein n=1 Tax=Catharanthus roseus TaxID=4058 RepID=A0ACC0BW16_CATRO|nr:hypothetical protein M9H77_07719 [Catharanthus roseus]
MESPEELLQENIGFEHFRPNGEKFWATFAHLDEVTQNFCHSGRKCSRIFFFDEFNEDPNMFEEFLEPEEYIDLGHLFTTDRIFSSKDKLTYLIINRYRRSRTADRRPYVTLACKRGGAVKKYTKPVVDDEEEKIPIKRRGPYGTKISVYHHGNAQAARLTEEQLQQTEQFRKSHVLPHNILRFFREKDNRMQGKNTVDEVLCLSAQRVTRFYTKTVRRATYLNVAICTYNGYHI